MWTTNSANQWTGFYVVEISVMKGFNGKRTGGKKGRPTKFVIPIVDVHKTNF